MKNKMKKYKVREYEVLGREDLSRLFFEKMKKEYGEGEKISGPCGRDVEVVLYKFPNNVEVRVANKRLHGKRPTSVIISGKKIFRTKLNIEQKTISRLIRVKDGD